MPVPMSVDWHCLDLHRPDGSVSGFCYTLDYMCERQRQVAIDDKLGRPSACTTQRVAHCIKTTDTVAMGGQTWCARTAENCVRRRQDILSRDPPIVLHATECQPTLNIDPRDPTRDRPARAP